MTFLLTITPMTTFLTVFMATFTLTLGKVRVMSRGWGSAEPIMAGKISNAHVLFLADVFSTLDCGRLCLKYDCCAAFTTSPQTSSASSSSSTPRKSMSCRGHESRRMLMSNTHVAVAGSKTYIVKRPPSESSWLNGSCSASSDCPVSNAECFSTVNRCLCSPGYFYSHCRDACVPGCPKLDLEPTFMRYPFHRIFGTTGMIVSFTKTAMEECQAACAQSFPIPCLSIDHYFGSSNERCMLRDITSVNNLANFQSSPDYDYYQRTCL